MEEEKKPAAKKRASKPEKTKAPATNKGADEISDAPITTTVAAPASKSTRPKGSHKMWWMIIGTVGVLVILFLVVFGVLIYKYQSNSRIVQLVAGVVPYPAERVNGSFVTYSNYLFEVNSIKHYYLSQTGADNKPAIDFDSADGKKKLKELQSQELKRLQQEAVIKQLAAEQKVSVSDKEIDKQVDQITKSAGGAAKVKDVLKKFYGWDLNDLKQKIHMQLLQQKVAAKVQSDPKLDAQAKAKATDVLKKVNAGGDFAALAKQYSQDSSAANGGDLGFFGKGQMVKPFEDAAFNQQPGQVSKLVKSQFGYHIVKTVDFDQYLKDKVAKAKVNQFIHP
ncbi:MAG TPA: peptidylprolyl isomerase [Candidatus Polarisedimenticolaceae bacterium]|nr:peptidylprolyl isomerase [Candidatus Polarisedimenticolaceae bacterium]